MKYILITVVVILAGAGLLFKVYTPEKVAVDTEAVEKSNQSAQTEELISKPIDEIDQEEVETLPEVVQNDNESVLAAPEMTDADLQAANLVKQKFITAEQVEDYKAQLNSVLLVEQERMEDQNTEIIEENLE